MTRLHWRLQVDLSDTPGRDGVWIDLFGSGNAEFLFRVFRTVDKWAEICYMIWPGLS